MDTAQETDRDLFADVKDAFDRLALDQKASFLITESVNTAVEAVSTLVDTVAHECTEFFNAASQKADNSEGTDSSGDESVQDVEES